MNKVYAVGGGVAGFAGLRCSTRRFAMASVSLLVSCLLVTLGAVVGDGYATRSVYDRVARAMATACVSEDSHDCFWDATKYGNGVGRSYLDIGGVVYYVG